MKKKAWIIGIIGAAALCAVAVCAFLLALHIRFPKISPASVEKITVWTHTRAVEYELTPEDKKALIALYNDAQYKGTGTGEGGTPEFGARVYFKDGSLLVINDFSAPGKHFEVSLRSAKGTKLAWFYVNDQELRDFLAQQAESLKR